MSRETIIPLTAVKGRGAASRIAHRFERDVRDDFDDGWDTLQEGATDAPAAATQVTFEEAKSIISRNESPDVHFDYSVNPYRGCEHDTPRPSLSVMTRMRRLTAPEMKTRID